MTQGGDVARENRTMEASTARPSGHGWITFAGVLFLIAGAANVLWGIGALDNKEYLPESGVLFSTLTLWGWVAIVWGVLECGAAFLLLSGSSAGPVVGLVLATIGAIFWVLVLPVLPIFALVAIILLVLVIYGLSAHADAVR